MEILEYEDALDDLLRDAEKAGGVISISDMWNAAINAAIEHIEGSAFADKACAEDQSAENDAGDIYRLNMRSKFGYEMAARIRELLVPNAVVQASGAQTLNQGAAACSASPATES